MKQLGQLEVDNVVLIMSSLRVKRFKMLKLYVKDILWERIYSKM